MTGTSLIDTMADRYQMEPSLYAKTVRATVMPSEHTDEQFRAFMMVAYEYHLNPITREIYAFPNGKGGIVPVVSIDGWVHLVNSHPQCNGFKFEEVLDEKGKLIGMTCIMHRHDRSHPVVITEWLSECYRKTIPWDQYPKRMLRHKALKETARYAFGFAGITDEDEARDQMIDITKAVKTIEHPIAGSIVEQIDEFVSASENAPPANAEVEAGAADAETQLRQSPDNPAPDLAEAKRDAIDKLMREATDKQFDVNDRLGNIEAQIPIWEERLAEDRDFLKSAITTVAKVAKGELKEATARKYLEGL